MNIYRNQSEIEQKVNIPAGGTYGMPSQNVSGTSSTEGNASVKRAGSRGVSVNFNGGIRGNQAYEEFGKTIEDVMAEAGNTNVALQKDYMTLMANTMSDEDFAKMQKDGFDPGKMEPEEVVTIVDEIKAKLAESGVVVSGYNDDMDAELLEKITGSSARAQEIVDAFHEVDIPVTEKNVTEATAAMEMADSLTEYTEGMKKYLLENRLEPTLKNLYRAAYSGSNHADIQSRGYFAEMTGGYYGKKAESVDVADLKASFEKIIENAGYEVTKETLQDAAWMVEMGIPLTEDTFSHMEKIKDISLPMEEHFLAKTVAKAIAEGKGAKGADLNNGESVMETALRIKEETDAISESSIDRVLVKGKNVEEINLRDLMEESKESKSPSEDVATESMFPSGAVAAENMDMSGEITMESMSASGEVAMDSTYSSVSIRRQLEEIRLFMTVQVNVRLLKQGISIDTTPLSELVTRLKEEEQKLQSIMFKTEDRELASARNQLYRDVNDHMRAIPGMPVSLVGRLSFHRMEQVTLDEVYATGLERQKAYEKAEEKYEPLMTGVRSDYGDSIKKAFRNVDDILENMKMETTESNRRAVRILGYNSMEITKENIHAVKEAYLTVSRVVEKMTPAATLSLIREGSNPLEMSMEELYDRLTQMEDQADPEKSYSKFLFRLEQSKSISPEEKDSYIGIYRLLHQVEKRDGAAVGSLLHQGAEINFKNLLTAVRTTRAKRMDYAVDDSFGSLEEGLRQESSYRNSISDAIDTAFRKEMPEITYYEKLAGATKEMLVPDVVTDVIEGKDCSLESLYDELQETFQEGLEREEASLLRESAAVSEQAFSMLQEENISTTLEHLVAADQLLLHRGAMAKEVKKQAKLQDYETELKDAIKELRENFTSEDTAKDAYEKMVDTMEQVLFNAGEEQKETIDLRQINSVWKQVTLARNLAREEHYEIPMEIGDEITSVSVKIKRNGKSGGNNAGRVTITTELPEIGKISALFEGKELSGYVFCDRVDGLSKLKEQEAKFAEAMKENDYSISEIKFIQSDRVDINNYPEKADDNSTRVSSVQLYETAKIFLQTFLA